MSYNYEKYLSTYEAVTILPGSKQEIRFRPLTTNDMKKLLVYENQKDPVVGENILDQIINDVVLTEGFDVNKLYLQDRYFLFIELRKVTKGKVYNFPFTCKDKECKSQSLQTINLDNLKIKNLNEDEIEKELKILNGNLTLEMGFITRGEQKEAFSHIDKNLSVSQKQVEMVIADIASSIKSITTPEGKEELPIQKRMDFIGKLPRNEYDKLSEWYQENDFGIDLNIEIKCPHCSVESEKIVMPLDNFFV